MKQVVIENPVINSPFEEPKRHFLRQAEEKALETSRMLRFQGRLRLFIQAMVV